MIRGKYEVESELTRPGGRCVMVRSRRGWLEVVADILDAANKRGGVNKTRIVYKANLNFRRIESYLEILMEGGLIEKHSAEGLFKTTERGRDFLKRYREIREFI